MPYAALLALAGFDAAGYGLVAPVVPAIAHRTGVGAALIGVLVAAFAVGMAAGFILGGIAVRRRGARVALAGSVVLIAAGSALFAVFDEYGVYLVGRVLQGVGSGALWIGVVFGVLERFPGQEYRRLTGVLSAYSIGAVAGPALGAVGGIRGPFTLYLGLSVLGLIAVALTGSTLERPAFGTDRSALWGPGFRFSSAGILVVALGYGALEGPLPLHFSKHLSQLEISGLFAAASLVVGISALAAGRLRPRIAILVGGVVITTGVALAGAGDLTWIWVLAVVGSAVGFGLGETGAMGALLSAVGAGGMLAAIVIWSQLWSIGYLVGPALAGLIAEEIGFAFVGLVPALVLALLVTMALRRSKPSSA